MKNIPLTSGYSIPALGLGTWLLTGTECYKAIITALKNGYTHIDTAVMYENEEIIGKAIKDSGIPRKDLFITTKIWYEHLHYRDVILQASKSLEKLKTDYIDLLLIHWPNRSIPFKETFEAFEVLVESKKIRSIGVSNFTVHHIEKAIIATTLPISVNQVEFNPLFYQKELYEFCKEHKIAVTAYSPLARGKVFQNEILTKIAQSKKCDAGLISLAWLLNKGIVVIPKASSEDHIRNNFHALEVLLNEEEVKQIDNIKTHERMIYPEWGDFNY